MEIKYLSYMVYLVSGILLLIGVAQLRRCFDMCGGRFSSVSIQENGSRLKSRLVNTRMAQKRRERKIDGEIYESIVLLRNIITLNKGENAGSEYILEVLSSQATVLQPAYMKMLTYIRVGKDKEAYEVFERETETDIGRELGVLLMHWDEISPSKLLEILETQQKNIRERRITYQKKQDEIISEIMYLPVILNVFVIFINFIYVAFFIQQQEMLEAIF